MQFDEFELFIACYEEGKSVGFPLQKMHEAFESDLELFEHHGSMDEWKVKYDPTRRCGVFAIPIPDQPDLASMISVQWPCDDLRIWNSLFKLLSMGNLALAFTAPHYWKQKNFLIVAQKADLNHFARAMEVRRVSCGAEICRELKTA